MFQQLTIVGNLGDDPEMRFFPDGTAVTNFSVAANRRWGQGDERKEEVCWFRVSAVGKQAEVCNEYLSKGRQVLVVGRLQPGKHGGPKVFQRNDGTAGASYEVRASSVTFLGGGQEDGGSVPYREEQEEDEIPF